MQEELEKVINWLDWTAFTAHFPDESPKASSLLVILLRNQHFAKVSQLIESLVMMNSFWLSGSQKTKSWRA